MCTAQALSTSLAESDGREALTKLSDRLSGGLAVRSCLALVTSAAVALSGCSYLDPASSQVKAGGFYSPSSPLPEAKPGTLIRSEPLAAPAGVRGWRILYHSRSVTDADIAVSGAVFLPSTAAPAGGRSVVAWAHGTAGLGDSCAPSATSDVLGGIPQGAELLAAGDAVVATDYAGLGTPGLHPYLVGISEGRSILDAVRAAASLPAAELSSATVIFGHSQGGHAALFAAKIASKYAPALKVRGVVAAAPPTDLVAIADHITTLDDGTAYLLMLAGGYSAADPRAQLDSILTPEGSKAAQLLEQGCAGELIKALKGVPVAKIFAQDPRTVEPWSSGLRRDSIRTVPSTIPLLVLQGGDDPIVPAPVTAQTVQQMCSGGDHVDYFLYPQAGHDVVPSGAQALMDWTESRFAGRPATTNC